MSVTYFQAPIHPTDRDAVAVPASTRNGPVLVWLCDEGAERLGQRKLHIGSHGYAALAVDGQATPVHRWLMGAQRGDGRMVDHINGDGLDNRLSNLRWSSPQHNAGNRKPSALSGLRGVMRSGNRWIAQAKLNGRSVYLGSFLDKDDAGQVAHEWRVRNLPGYEGDDRTRYSNAVTTA